MKVSIPWLKELVDLKISPEELAKLLSLKTIAVKEVTNDFIELDMKGYNRADLLSLRGVAQEVAAITNSEIKFNDNAAFSWAMRHIPKLEVKVEDLNLATVQIVAKIENLKVEQSDNAWVQKLSQSGMRAVNNIADLTNLIMLEYGQPLHAFDASTVEDETIIIRRAKNDEEIITLDSKLRKLTSEDIVLADSEKALDVAGIMGGKDTEIKNSTQTILLSGSMFNPNMVRKTANRLRLGSEASKRFYHGLTKKRLFLSMSEAIKVLEKMGGKLTGFGVVGDTIDKIVVLNLSHQKINSLIGVDIPKEEIEGYLKKLGFKLEDSDNGWKVTVPFWRLDIEIEEDLIEEVARMYGYEKIPAKELEPSTSEKIDQTLPNQIYDLKVKLANLGLTEAQSYSFYSTAVLEALGNAMDNKDNLVKITNPISSETEYMRQDLWPNLVEIIGRNIRQGFKDIAIFEIGKVYSKENEKPTEKYRLSISLMNGTDNPMAELFALVQNLEKLKAADLNPSYFHPVRIKNGIGEIHLRLLNKLGIEKRVAVAELVF